MRTNLSARLPWVWRTNNPVPDPNLVATTVPAAVTVASFAVASVSREEPQTRSQIMLQTLPTREPKARGVLVLPRCMRI